MAATRQHAEALSAGELLRLLLGRWRTLRDALGACGVEPSGAVSHAALQRLFATAAQRADAVGARASEHSEFRVRLQEGVAQLFGTLAAKCRANADSGTGGGDVSQALVSDGALNPPAACDAGDAANDGATVPCRSLLFALGACAPRDGFMRWASSVFLLGGYEAFDDLLGQPVGATRSNGSGSTPARVRVGRDDFREFVALLNGNSDDAGLWHDALVRAGRPSPGAADEEGVDVYVLNRQALANPRFLAEEPMGLQDVAVRLIAVWGDLTAAFGLTPSGTREEGKSARGSGASVGRRGWRPCRSQWLRALCGKRGRFLYAERESRLESDRLAAMALEVGDTAFPNIGDRLLVPKTDWRPGEVITVRYTLAETGFWGSCGGQALCLVGPGRRVPLAMLGHRPFIAAVRAAEDRSAQAATGDSIYAATAPVDPHEAAGAVVLQVPEPEEDECLASRWQLRLYASDDGLRPTAALSHPLQICVLMAPPAPPADIAAHTSAHNAALLQWGVSADDMGSSVLGYEVAVWEWEGGLSSGDDRPAVWSERSTRRSTSAGPLLPSTRYVARVRCTSRAGSGPWSKESEMFETLPALPARLAPPEAASAGPTEARLSWSFDDDCMRPTKSSAPLESRRPTRYSVRVLPTPCEPQDGGEPTVHTFDGSSTEAVVPGLTANTTYCFEIRAHNVSGVGAWSEPSGCILTHPGLPTAPNPPVSAEVTQDAMLLRWQAPGNDGGSPVTGYVLRVEPSDDDGDVEIIADAPPVWVRGLRGNCWYSVSVAAVTSQGAGPFSAATALRTACLPPGTPTQMRVVSLRAESVAVEWAPPLDDGGGTINRYVLRAEPSAGHAAVEVEAAAGACRAVLPPLAGSSPYSLTVRAESRGGASPFSEALRILTEPAAPAPPAAPPRLCAEGSTKTSLAIEWDASTTDGGSPIDEYELQVISVDRQQTSEGAQPRGLWAGKALALCVARLNLGQGYAFAVRARNDRGWGPCGPWSQVIRTAPPPPLPPQQLRPVESTAASITVEWDPPESDCALVEYEVSCCGPIKVGGGQRRARTKRTECRMTGLARFSSYVFRVRARSFSGWGLWSEPSEVLRTMGAATWEEARDSILRRFGGTVSSAFRALDRDGDGAVSRDEFAAAFGDPTEGLRLFVALDVAGRGRLGYREFAQCFSQFKATPAVMRHNVHEYSEDDRQQLLEEAYHGRRSSAMTMDPRAAEVVARLTSPRSRQRLSSKEIRERGRGRPEAEGHGALRRLASGGSFHMKATRPLEEVETSPSVASESLLSGEDSLQVRTALSPPARPCPVAASPRGFPAPRCGAQVPARQISAGRANAVLLGATAPATGCAAQARHGAASRSPSRSGSASPRASASASPRVGSWAYAAGPAGTASTKVLEALRQTRRQQGPGKPGVSLRAPPSGVFARHEGAE